MPEAMLDRATMMTGNKINQVIVPSEREIHVDTAIVEAGVKKVIKIGILGKVVDEVEIEIEGVAITGVLEVEVVVIVVTEGVPEKGVQESEVEIVMRTEVRTVIAGVAAVVVVTAVIGADLWKGVQDIVIEVENEGRKGIRHIIEVTGGTDDTTMVGVIEERAINDTDTVIRGRGLARGLARSLPRNQVVR